MFLNETKRNARKTPPSSLYTLYLCVVETLYVIKTSPQTNPMMAKTTTKPKNMAYLAPKSSSFKSVWDLTPIRENVMIRNDLPSCRTAFFRCCTAPGHPPSTSTSSTMEMISIGQIR